MDTHTSKDGHRGCGCDFRLHVTCWRQNSLDSKNNACVLCQTIWLHLTSTTCMNCRQPICSCGRWGSLSPVSLPLFAHPLSLVHKLLRALSLSVSLRIDCCCCACSNLALNCYFGSAQIRCTASSPNASRQRAALPLEAGASALCCCARWASMQHPASPSSRPGCVPVGRELNSPGKNSEFLNSPRRRNIT